jgi:hypothetical protein
MVSTYSPIHSRRFAAALAVAWLLTVCHAGFAQSTFGTVLVVQVFGSSKIARELSVFDNTLLTNSGPDRYRAWSDGAKSLILTLVEGAKKDLRIEHEHSSSPQNSA